MSLAPVFVAFHKRDCDGRDEVSVRADAVLAVIAGNRQGSAIVLRDSEHLIGVVEDVPTVIARLNEALEGDK